MAVPTKAEQEAESRARAEAGNDPAANLQALNVTDDAPRGDPGEGRPNPQPREAEAPRQPPPVKSKFDDKRAEILGRFREHRAEIAKEAADDSISDFQRTGMPPEWEPQAEAQPEPQAELQPETQGEPQPEAKPQTVRVKVHGKEIDLPIDEVIAKAQIALASDNVLDEAKAKANAAARELDGLLSQARDRVARVDPQPGANQSRPQINAQRPGEQSADQPAQTDLANQEDPVAKLIESIQFGDPKEAAPVLQNTIAEMVAKGVQEQLERQRLQDEGARAAKALSDFEGQHAEIAKDPMARAAIEAAVLNQQVEDIKALGINLNQLRPDGLDPTPGDIAAAHRWYRTKGFKVSTPETMLEGATKKYLDWRGETKPPAADPAKPPVVDTKAAPRIEVSVERQERRTAVPQQPSRSGTPPRVAAPAAPQVRDRSQIVQEEIARRNRPRGRVGVA